MIDREATQDAFERQLAWFSRPGATYGYDPDQAIDQDVPETEYGVCLYRGDDDPASPCRCAVGCLIPDDRYDPSIEGQSAKALDFEALGLDGISSEFLQDAQRLHDDSAKAGEPLAHFLGELRWLGSQNGLVVR